jgi:hypothetical protein
MQPVDLSQDTFHPVAFHGASGTPAGREAGLDGYVLTYLLPGYGPVHKPDASARHRFHFSPPSLEERADQGAPFQAI